MSRHGVHTPPGPLIVDVAGLELDAEDRELLMHPAVGGVILFSRNCADTQQLRALTHAICACRPHIPIAADYEGGRVQRFRDGMTPVPAMRDVGRLWHDNPAAATALAADIGWLVAAELAAVGVDMPLAPVVDLDYGQSSVIGARAFAEQTDTVARLAQAYMGGLREGGSVATAKHFPGHGYVVPDSHAELPVDARDAAALATDMAPYRALIAAGLASIMMAHIRYPAVDDLPASLSSRWIRDELRTRLAFSGAVFCDDLSMGGAAQIGDYGERAALALAAGCDYLPVCNNRAAAAALVEAPAMREDAGPARRQQLQACCRQGDDAASLALLQTQPRWQQINAEMQALSAQSA